MSAIWTTVGSSSISGNPIFYSSLVTVVRPYRFMVKDYVHPLTLYTESVKRIARTNKGKGI